MGEGSGDGRIPFGKILIDFSEAVLGDDDTALSAARLAVHEQMGDAALASGIPLEPEKAAATADFRSELGINDFESMRHRPAYE